MIAAASQPTRLSLALGRIAQRFPLPFEAVSQIDPKKVRDFVALVNQSHTHSEVIALARTLPHSSLDLIFPALTTKDLDETERSRRTVDRLLLVLRERACPSLYNKAWVVWQRHYPHDLATKALAVLCGIIEIKRAGADTKVQPSGLTPLITGLIDLSGHTQSRKLIAYLEHHPLTLNQVIARYAFDPTSAFGRSVLIEAFMNGTDAMFIEQIDRLERVFPLADTESKARIMRHFLTLQPLTDDIRQRAHVIFYRSVGTPGGPSAVWPLLNERERRAFGDWVMRSKIGSHCLSYPDKARFYLRYADTLQRVESWDKDTLLMYFGHFVIADDARYPEQALFYAGSVPSPHPGGLADPDRSLSPGNPAIAHRRVEEVLRQGQVSGIVQLHFDPEGLKQAGVLLDFALQSRPPQGIFAPLRNRSRQLT